MVEVKISAIVPTLNSQAFLGYALMSVVEHVDEIIVIDMGSTDNTKAIIGAIKSSKIRFLLLRDLIQTPEEHNLDSTFRHGLYLATGNVVLRVDDDWVWGDKMQCLRDYCRKALLENKRGLMCSVYNMITTNAYFLPIRHRPFIMFRYSERDPLVSFGSYCKDNNLICHKSEIKRSSGREFALIKRSRYSNVSLPLGHWKFLKDTQSDFIRKWRLFTGCSGRDALEKWDYYHNQTRGLCPAELLMPLQKYRDLFIPLGGFDIR